MLKPVRRSILARAETSLKHLLTDNGLTPKAVVG